MKYINLKCLAANVIQLFGLNMEVGVVPEHSLAFYQEQLWNGFVITANNYLEILYLASTV